MSQPIGNMLDAVGVTAPDLEPGEARVWFTTGDTPPVVGGGRHCWYIPAGAVTGDNRGALTGARRVQLISSGAATVVLQRA